ncbi:MAG: AzlD domain-containing protein [Gammaproteobacteria bacterium WSBS_2016_MAG_OTU1]
MTPVLMMILGVAAVTYFWRVAGVLAAGKIHAGSPMFRFFSCVSYAMIAALIFRLILYPVGATAAVPTSFRLLSAAVGLVVFIICRRNVAAGAWAGVLSILSLNAIVD